MLQAPQVNGKPQAQGKDDEVAIQRLLKQAEMVCTSLMLLCHTHDARVTLCICMLELPIRLKEHQPALS